MPAPFDPRKSITLKQACRLLPGRGGRPAHEDTVRRWAVRGCRLPDGSCVRLKTVKLAGTRLTMPEWVEDFGRLRLLGGSG